MTNQWLTTYLHARQTLVEVTKKVEESIAGITGAAVSLKDWRHVHIPSVNLFPFQLNRVPEVPPWPSTQELGDLLKRWHSAKSAVDTAWQQVPHQDRQGVLPPPD